VYFLALLQRLPFKLVWMGNGVALLSEGALLLSGGLTLTFIDSDATDDESTLIAWAIIILLTTTLIFIAIASAIVVSAEIASRVILYIKSRRRTIDIESEGSGSDKDDTIKKHTLASSSRHPGTPSATYDIMISPARSILRKFLMVND
jgi:hypothetical protein